MEDRKGSVCEKHGEYSPSGICRWCDPVKASSPPAIGMLTASKEPGPFGAGRGFTHIPGLCTCTACIVSERPLIPKHPLPQWAVDDRVVCYGGCACGEFVVYDDPAYVFLSGSGVKHSAFGCLPVASEGPKAASLSEIYRGKP